MANYDFLEFHVKGLHADIEQLVSKLNNKELDIDYWWIEDIVKINDAESDVKIGHLDASKLQLLDNFAQLKVIGVVEDWSDRSCKIWFSDYSSPKYVTTHLGYFNGDDEDRWTYDLDPVTGFQTKRKKYNRPYEKEWNEEYKQ